MYYLLPSAPTAAQLDRTLRTGSRAICHLAHVHGASVWGRLVMLPSNSMDTSCAHLCILFCNPSHCTVLIFIWFRSSIGNGSTRPERLYWEEYLPVGKQALTDIEMEEARAAIEEQSFNTARDEVRHLKCFRCEVLKCVYL